MQVKWRRISAEKIQGGQPATAKPACPAPASGEDQRRIPRSFSAMVAEMGLTSGGKLQNGTGASEFT